jgi:flagellar basal body P-ring protein FlgI
MTFGKRLISLWLAVALCSTGCQKFSFRSQTPDDDELKPPETTFIADQVTISGLHPIQIEAVGLVTNLDNTGGDPPPSLYRTLLLNEMRRQNVKNPNTFLQSPRNALVIVRAALPPVIQIGERFDVEVVLPESSEATSIKGGWLLPTYMAEQAIVPGKGPVRGHTVAIADGPVLLSISNEKSSDTSGLKRGRILGGGVYKGDLTHKNRELGLYLRNDLRSVRQAKRIADHIGKRFYSYDNAVKKSLAVAKTDQYIELTVHPRYRENYVRYVQVIRHIALNESAVEQRERMERLRKTLLDPATTLRSAMELEAIGIDSIPVLKEGLKSRDFEVRFYSADALAYLGDSSGAPELAAAARNEEAFRVFALAALAVIDEPPTRELLKELIAEPTIETRDGKPHELWSAETRYGAFRTLRSMDKQDEFIRGELINEEFHLHVLPVNDGSLIHLSRYHTPEIVVFNGEQRLRTPISLAAGRHILITAPAQSNTVTVSRLSANDDDDRILTTSTRVADIIRAVGQLNAHYPDVAQMLVQAEEQGNITGRLALDAVPQSGRIYHREASAAAAPTGAAPRSATRVGRSVLAPNLFPAAGNRRDAADDEEPPATDGQETVAAPAAADGAGEASLADAPDRPATAAPEKRGLFARLFGSRQREPEAE